MIILPAQALIALTQPPIDTGHVIIRLGCVIIPHPAVIIEPATTLIATPQVSLLDLAGALNEVCVCSLTPLRRWGIALRYEPTGKVHASRLTATAYPAVAPSLVWGRYVRLQFLRVLSEFVCPPLLDILWKLEWSMLCRVNSDSALVLENIYYAALSQSADLVGGRSDFSTLQLH